MLRKNRQNVLNSLIINAEERLLEVVSLLICVHERAQNQPSCSGFGAPELESWLRAGLSERGLDVPIVRIHCLGFCARGPNVRIAPGGNFYHQVDQPMVTTLLDDLEQALARAREFNETSYAR